MTLILEGPDLAGKTTLAQELGWDIIKRSSARGQEKCYQASMELPAGSFIWDRWFLSEMVYGRMFRNFKAFSTTQLWQMALLAETHGASFLYCPPLSKGEVAKRFKLRGDSEWTLPQIQAVHTTYEKTLYEIIRYLPMVHLRLETAMKEHKKKQEYLALLKEMDLDACGSPLPGKTMLVGDTQNHGQALFPFHVLTGNNCGTYLWETLHRTSLWPMNTFIVNSIGLNGKYPDFNLLIKTLRPKTIIALGGEARHRLQIQDIKNVYTVPHPAYRKRFKYDFIQEYAERFERILDVSEKH